MSTICFLSLINWLWSKTSFHGKMEKFYGRLLIILDLGEIILVFVFDGSRKHVRFFLQYFAIKQTKHDKQIQHFISSKYQGEGVEAHLARWQTLTAQNYPLFVFLCPFQIQGV